MILGFTGTQQIPLGGYTSMRFVLSHLVDTYDIEAVVTGGCIGVDAYVHHWFATTHPDIRRIVTLPENKSKVDMRVVDTANEVHDDSDSYRARNEHIVALSDRVAALWHGQKMYSGTYMTMNIAAKQGKLHPEDVFGVGISHSEARRRYGF